eukprot:m.50572 g.50572  ORF g.50572 m.50572 type:complete len:546 (-) comp13435_c0_seq1:58-1695(-)
MLRLRSSHGRRGFRTTTERQSPNLEQQPDDAEERLASSEDDELSSQLPSHEAEPKRSLRRRLRNPFKRAHKRLPLPTPLFGSELSAATEHSRLDDNLDVPSIVRRCVSYITEHGLEQEGLYRLSGRKSQIEHLKQLFDEQHDVDLEAELPNGGSDDVNVAASLLKLYFRELPTPILTEQLTQDFTKVAHHSKDLDQLQQLLSTIPQPHYMTLGWIIKHLVEVIALSDQNKMTKDNIYIVFTPTLNINKNLLELMLDEPSACFPHVTLKHRVNPHDVLRLSPCKPSRPRSMSPRSFSPRSIRRRKHTSAPAASPALPSEQDMKSAVTPDNLHEMRSIIEQYEQHVRQQTQEEYTQPKGDLEQPAWAQLHQAQQQVTKAKRLHRRRSIELLERMDRSSRKPSLDTELETPEGTQDGSSLPSLATDEADDGQPCADVLVLELEKLCSQLLAENEGLAYLNQLRKEELEYSTQEADVLQASLDQVDDALKSVAGAEELSVDAAVKMAQEVERQIHFLYEEQAVLKGLNNSLMMDLAYETELCVSLNAQL